MKRSIASRLSALLLALVLLCSLVGCSASREVRASRNASKVVATAGEVEITYDEYYYLAMNYIAELKKAHGEGALSDPELVAQLKTFMAENLLNRTHALLSLAKDYGVDVEKGEIAENVQKQIDDIVENSFGGDRKAYIESLNQNYLTDRYVRTYIAVQDYLAVQIVKEMLDRGELDDSDETARANINGPDLIRVNQVLIETRNYVSREAALNKANELRAKVLAATEINTRTEAMRAAMQFSTYLDEGHGLYFARGEMDAAFEQAAFALEEYGVSEVLEVEGGFCFLMRMPKEESYITENFEVLKQKSYFVALNAKVDARLAGMTLTMTKFGSSLDPAQLPAVDADGGELFFTLTMVGIGVVALAVVVGAIWWFSEKRRAGSAKKR